MGFSTVLFDLDGTLSDSQAGIVASYRHTLAAFGLDADEAAIKRWIGPPLGEGLAALGVPADRVEEAVARYRAYFGATGMYDNRLYDGAADMLAELRSAGVTLGLATSKLQRFAAAILDHFGLAEHFAVVCGVAGDGSRSTKEEVVGFALATLGGPEPSTVALVGDREHDIRAALHHGLHPVGVTWGYGDRREMQASAGAAIVAIVEDVPALTRLLLSGSVGVTPPG